MKTVITKATNILAPFDDLFIEPVIIRVNKFTEESAKTFANEMSLAHSTGQPVIPVIVDSFGGQVYALLAMIAEIDHASLPVATISVGKSMSAGSILLAAGTPGYRYMDSNSTVMVHEAGSGTIGKLEDMKVSVKETERLNKLIFEKLAKYSGKDKKYFLNLISSKKNSDWFLTAADAKKHGIVDHIGMPEFRCHVSVDMEFVSKR